MKVWILGSCGACATLSARQNYDMAKKKDMGAADANGDGVVNLKSEMNYAHAYYASAFDKGGVTIITTQLPKLSSMAVK